MPFIMAVSGSGKTTFINKNKSRFPMLVDGDDILRDSAEYSRWKNLYKVDRQQRKGKKSDILHEYEKTHPDKIVVTSSDPGRMIDRHWQVRKRMIVVSIPKQDLRRNISSRIKAGQTHKPHDLEKILDWHNGYEITAAVHDVPVVDNFEEAVHYFIA